jgi:hypothetical protein
MKTMFFAAVLVLGVAVLGGAQTTPDVYPQVHASEWVMRDATSNVGHLSGNVDFTLGISTLWTTHIRADEAIIGQSHDIELRGNVHLITGPDAGRIRVAADTIR